MPASKPGDHGRHSPGIQLDEDHCFQHRMWRIERIGWWGIAAVVLAAAAGLFGHGPLSRATLHVADSITPSPGMSLDYERFGRAHGESQMRLTGPPDRIDDGTFSVWFSREYLGEVEVLRITPDPAAQELASNGMRYHFRVQDGSPAVTFRFKPQRPGRLSGQVRLNDGPPANFQQWLFP